MPRAGTCLDRPRVRVESLTEISGALAIDTRRQLDGDKPREREGPGLVRFRGAQDDPAGDIGEGAPYIMRRRSKSISQTRRAVASPQGKPVYASRRISRGQARDPRGEPLPPIRRTGENPRPVPSKALPYAARTEDQAVRIQWRAREYERTCADCGHAWRVPRWAAHPRMKGLPMYRGGSGGVQQATGAVVAANAELAERASVFRVCPECNSVDYTQRPIRS